MNSDPEPMSGINCGGDKPEISAEQSINSRTRHLISAISYEVGKDNKLRALHGLLHHLHYNPESRITAVKEKAVSALLKQRHASKDEEILSLVREVLCLLGYVDPPKGHGVRILSIDGGGVRGVLAIKFMMKLEALTKKPIHELFDYVCGVSTGAILACSIFPQKRSLEEILANYKDLSKQVFQSNVLSGTGRLIRNQGYYNTTKWEELLQKMIGSTMMIHTSRDGTCPKISAISTIANTKSSSFIFRNYELRNNVRSQYYGSSEHLMWEAVRASSAAPLYFKEFKLGNYLHQDGGLKANNPCAVAIHEARLLWPSEPLQCVVSLGTGLSKPKLSTTVPSTSSWSNQFSYLVDSATDTEGVHIFLSDMLPRNRYYRFNPFLTEMLGMSEFRTEKIEQLELDSEVYYWQNEEMFKAAAQTLLASRTTTQKLGDWLSLRANILGFKANL